MLVTHYLRGDEYDGHKKLCHVALLSILKENTNNIHKNAKHINETQMEWK